MLNRRSMIAAGLAAPALAAMAGAGLAQTAPSPGAKPNSVVNGVRLGLQPFCYHDLAVSAANRPLLIDGMLRNGLSIVELHQGWAEPPFSGPTARQQLRDWRLSAPASHWAGVRREFDAAGVEVFSIYFNFDLEMPESEIAAIYRAAKALGAKGVVGSYGLEVTQRLARLPSTEGLFIGIHNHDNLSDPDAYSTAETFEKGLAMSPNVKVTLDTRHFTAANGDCLGFLTRRHERISSVHLGDRRRNNGRSTPFGQGDAPLVEILRTLRDNRWPITALLEFEHGSLRSGVEEVQLCLDFCKRALA